MVSGKIVKKFNLDGKKVVFYYPKFEDFLGLQKVINSLVAEKAMITIQKKQKKEEEINWLIGKLAEIEKKKAVFLLAEVDGEIMGSAGVTRRGIPTEKHIGDLGICLTKKIRGKKVGEKLLMAIIKEAKKRLKINMVVLRVMGPNKIAQNLYKKIGCRQVGRIKKGMAHYGKYVDEVIMVKYL